MITLYTWTTPNGRKISIAPEVRRWCDAIAAPPAVQRGMAVPQ